jgi:hypothetical protein
LLHNVNKPSFYSIISSNTVPPCVRLFFLFNGLLLSWVESLEALFLFLRLGCTLLFWFSVTFNDDLITRPERLLRGVVKVETCILLGVGYIANQDDSFTSLPFSPACTVFIPFLP